jgi:hypothetical protein
MLPRQPSAFSGRSDPGASESTTIAARRARQALENMDVSNDTEPPKVFGGSGEVSKCQRGGMTPFMRSK